MRRICCVLGLAALTLTGCMKPGVHYARRSDAASAGSPGAVALHDFDGLEEIRPPDGPFDAEDYNNIDENPFVAVADDPRSTFSIDVDTASYSNTRRFLNEGQLPPADAVRIEELINYFEYDYPEPRGATPFSVTTEVAACPWQPEHRLVHVGLQGKHVNSGAIPARNLVFLVDVSGSMQSPDKLPLLKEGLAMLAEGLREDDRLSIVVYAGNAGTLLTPTSDKRKVKRALRRLTAGGSTNGEGGIRRAYELAQRSFVEGGINRVILASDGDFNVGVTSQGELIDLIEDKRESGVFLSVLGFGTGNLNDAMMEQIADRGNGNYAYIDGRKEARRVLVEQANATLVPIAKDVKIQVEFNPAEVEAYRLIGYENRKLEDQDFNDDEKDAGEIGAGHTVTALYEIVTAGSGEISGNVDRLKYQNEGGASAAARSGEMMSIKIRYKQPDGADSQLLTRAVRDTGATLEAASPDFHFSAAVAAFGMTLRSSDRRGTASHAMAYDLARGALRSEKNGSEARREFLDLVRAAAKLTGSQLQRAR